MARIAGVNIPLNKRVEVGLTYVYGIGRPDREQAPARAWTSRRTRGPGPHRGRGGAPCRDLIDRDVVVEGDLRRERSQNVKRLMEIGCYRACAIVAGCPSGARTRRRTPAPARVQAASRWPARRRPGEVGLTVPAPKRPPAGPPQAEEEHPDRPGPHQDQLHNTIVSLTDREGNVIAWESAGGAGFKGSRKSTPFAAQVTADARCPQGHRAGPAEGRGLRQGTGLGRETAIRSLQAAGPRGHERQGRHARKPTTAAAPASGAASEGGSRWLETQDHSASSAAARGRSSSSRASAASPDKCGVERRAYPPATTAVGARCRRVPRPAARESRGARRYYGVWRSSSATTTRRPAASRGSRARTC
jgi:small subunit ribosomal protein S11